MPKAQYIPQWPVVGHQWAVEHVTNSLNHKRIRHAYLINGPAAIGKTTFARAFAQAVNCQHPEFRPCGECRSCVLIARDGYADVSIIEADGGTMKIEQIREMQHSLSLRPVEARYRVLILRRFNEATPQAMDALLKTLEEPPPYVILLLTVDTADSILPTIRSRCQPINLRALPAPVIRDALVEFWQVETERAALLAQLSGGRMGWAVRAAADDSLLTDRTQWLAVLEEAIGLGRVGRFALADSMSKDKDALFYGLELWQSYWRDVMLRSHNAITAITNRDHEHSISQISAAVSVEDIQRVLAGISRTRRYLDQNANPRLTVEVLMLDLPRVHLMAPLPV